MKIVAPQVDGIKLDYINDVDTTSVAPTDGQSLVFNQASGLWKPSSVGAGSSPLNNFSATTAPTENDDSGDGYVVGSVWIDVVAEKSYTCVKATVGSAVWSSGGGGDGGNTSQLKAFSAAMG